MENLTIAKEHLKDMERLIRNQKFCIVDAQIFLEVALKLYRSVEQLEQSRDNWKFKYEKLKEKKENE